MSTTYDRCACPHCGQDIEYPVEISAQVIDCPSCQKPLTLPQNVPPAPTQGVVSSFLYKLKRAGQTAFDKRDLKKVLFDAVEDGVLTTDEILRVRSLMERSGIDESVLSEWGHDLFKKALDSLTPTNISPERVRSIEEIKNFLQVRDADVPEQLQRLDRWNYILKIRRGPLPAVQVQNVLLHKGEIVHWVEPAKLWEQKVVSRRYEGGYSGVSVRIAKGLSIRTGGSRGHVVTDSADVLTSRGHFIVTSRRLIFSGDAKSFETNYEKLLNIQNHLDGICYSESNKQKPRKIQYDSPNGDIILEILSRVISDRGGEP